LINANDIWIMNVDGSELTRLTTDGAEKHNMDFLPGGEAISYIAGKCVKSIEIETGKIDNIACFLNASTLDEFQVSPDGQEVALVVNHALYLVPLDFEALAKAKSGSDLAKMGECGAFAPVLDAMVKTVQWSADQQSIGLLFVGVSDTGQRVDMFRIADISQCSGPWRIDEFPASRFEMGGYLQRPTFEDFSWDTHSLFAFNSFYRNDGYGYLYVYNSDLHRLQTVPNGYTYLDPVGACCYRDAVWSPDGSYLAFAFQDLLLGENSFIQLYYVPFGSIGTGEKFTPIPLPEGFFKYANEKPQIALRPAVP
jgi:hypothetical protein